MKKKNTLYVLFHLNVCFVKIFYEIVGGRKSFAEQLSSGALLRAATESLMSKFFLPMFNFFVGFSKLVIFCFLMK